MKILVLGGAGYIGSVLCRYILEHGDTPIVMDTFIYEKNKGKDLPYTCIIGDICNIDDLLPAIERADAVVNLAAISNDPASDLSPRLTWEINYKANETIAKLVRSSGKRVVYASSCSVYGFSENEIFDETSRMAPVTLYARTKMLSEDCYLREGMDSMVLRFATVYGNSPKPRFDLVVNTMVGSSFFTGKIVVNGGNQWRPVVHVKDVAKAIYMAVHAKNPAHRVYNVGSNDQNYTISQLADLIGSHIPNAKIIHNESSIDGRSYKADFSRIRQDLGYVTEYTIKDAVEEITKSFTSGEITNMEDDLYFRVKYLKRVGYGQTFIQRVVGKSSYLKNVINIF